MRRRTTATSLIVVLLCAAGLVEAAPVGQVTNLSGPLFAVSHGGARRVLSIGSQIEPGETLITEDKTYAQVRFIDKGMVTLKPGTQFKIEFFGFEDKAPEKDGAIFTLFKGALRSITGLIGKRGNQDAYRMSTTTATIGIRGTSFAATLCPSPACGDLPPGTYLEVFEGQVALLPPPALPGVPSLPTPAPLVLSAGQFGFAPPVGPPQQLPTDPGLGQHFNPPTSFEATQQQGQQTPAGEQPAGTSRQQQIQEGCEVR